MRQHVAKLGLAFLVGGGGGCSLIYNPDHIKVVADAKEFMDAPPPDSQIIVDANPSAISFDSTESNYPVAIDEGVGNHGAYPAIVELHGDNFTSMATVTFNPASAVTIVEQKVSSDHKYIVLALSAAIDGTCAKGANIPVAISVMQPDGAGGTAHADLDNTHFHVTCWNELMAAPTGALDEKYSNIEIGAGLTFAASGTDQPGVILRSTSHVVIGGDIVASASMQQAGPGGSQGGPTKTDGSGPGGGKAGTAPGIAGNGSSGGGGGYATTGTAGADSSAGNAGGPGGAMAGDPFIASYANNHSSGGGGGGQGTGGSIGVGGGGGGSVEVSATGDVTISGTVTAKGGDSTAGVASLGVKGGDGGAGSGGLIFLRSGGTLTVGTLSVAPGTPAGGGGAGSVGIIRVDTTSTTPPAGAQIGPMFVTPPKTVTAYPTINVRSYANDMNTTFEVIDKDNLVVDNGHTYMPKFGSGGAAQVTPVLRVGYNRLCALVKGNGDYSVAEGTNCVEIGYAP